LKCLQLSADGYNSTSNTSETYPTTSYEAYTTSKASNATYANKTTVETKASKAHSNAVKTNQATIDDYSWSNRLLNPNQLRTATNATYEDWLLLELSIQKDNLWGISLSLEGKAQKHRQSCKNRNLR
jgi:hypothetical protein